jgi:ABC-type proline/glycine betaine transport system permease subunit
LVLAWVALAAVALGTFVISVPARYAQFANPTAGVRDPLAEMGLSAGGYALYNVTLDAIFVSVFAVVASVIFWRRSEDSMALLVATMLVVWGPLNGLFVLSPSAIEWTHPVLEVTLNTLPAFVGYMAWMLFFYLFPSGRFVPRWTRWLALC